MKTIPPNPGEPATAPAAASTAASTAPPSGQAGAQPGPAASPLDRLAEVIESRRGADPDGSYVARLLARGEDAILKKIGEEATETVMAGKDGERGAIVRETADLWFHTLVLLAHFDLGPGDVLAELARREGVSGLAEKAARPATPGRTSS